jgi:hypothetical protein
MLYAQREKTGCYEEREKGEDQISRQGMTEQANEDEISIDRWNWVGIRELDVSARKHVGLAEVGDTLAYVSEIRKSLFGSYGQGTMRVGFMQDEYLNADNAPSDRSKHQ